MPLKHKTVLSRDDLREALDSHQISISQVAKATGVPRTYLSEFLSIGRPLKPEQLQKIREHLEGEGVEFENSAPGGNALPASLAVANICHFPVRPERIEEARAVLEEIERNDARIAELLDQQAIRKTDWKGDPQGFTSETEEALRELFALAGANYFLFRHLTGVNSPLAPAAAEQETVRSAVLRILEPSLSKAGVNATPQPEPAEEDA